MAETAGPITLALVSLVVTNCVLLSFFLWGAFFNTILGYARSKSVKDVG
jgi:hypothetical protein